MQLGVSIRFLIAIIVVGAMPGTVMAHPKVDEAVGLYEMADFERARQALDEAADANLDREELTLLLSTRALVYYALRDESQMTNALQQLLVVNGPDFDWGPAVAPEFVGAFSAAREAPASELSLELRVTLEGDEVVLAGQVTGDDTGLIRQVRISARAEGEVQESESGELRIGRAGDRVVYFASAVGPGNVTLAVRGTSDVPLVYTFPAPEIATSTPEVPAPRAPPLVVEDDTGPSALPFVLIGAAVAIGLGVALFFVLQPSEQSTLSGPNIDWMTGG